MGWPTTDTAAPVPLLAASAPTVTDSGKTITFKIKPNIHYSPPTGGGAGWSKPVVSADVKYAIERSLMPGVPNGYTTLYMPDVIGLSQAQAAVKKTPTKAPDISGIATPDPSTIVFHLSKSAGLRGEVRRQDADLDLRAASDRRWAVLHLGVPAR
jgi:peptide/nickel transport system substrate-binding protein